MRTLRTLQGCQCVRACPPHARTQYAHTRANERAERSTLDFTERISRMGCVARLLSPHLGSALAHPLAKAFLDLIICECGWLLVVKFASRGKPKRWGRSRAAGAPRLYGIAIGQAGCLSCACRHCNLDAPWVQL